MPLLSKSELLRNITTEWDALARVIAPLTEQQMTECRAGEWAVKDHLAHIAAWEKFLTVNQFHGQSPIDALAFPPAVLERNDENEMNAILWERHRGRAAADVLADMHATHAALIAELERATERELQTPTGMIGPRVEPKMTWVVWNTYEHYAEHRRTIEVKTR